MRGPQSSKLVAGVLEKCISFRGKRGIRSTLNGSTVIRMLL